MRLSTTLISMTAIASTAAAYSSNLYSRDLDYTYDLSDDTTLVTREAYAELLSGSEEQDSYLSLRDLSTSDLQTLFLIRSLHLSPRSPTPGAGSSVAKAAAKGVSKAAGKVASKVASKGGAKAVAKSGVKAAGKAIGKAAKSLAKDFGSSAADAAGSAVGQAAGNAVTGQGGQQQRRDLEWEEYLVAREIEGLWEDEY